jgi:hypothetical protein
VGLILDSSVVIASERLGQTAYQMLEAISHQKGDPEIAISVVTVAIALRAGQTDGQMQAAGMRVALTDLCDRSNRT